MSLYKVWGTCDGQRGFVTYVEAPTGAEAYQRAAAGWRGPPPRFRAGPEKKAKLKKWWNRFRLNVLQVSG